MKETIMSNVCIVKKYKRNTNYLTIEMHETNNLVKNQKSNLAFILFYKEATC
jgi:hypothetical protein